MRFALEGITSFSLIPLRIGIIIGLLTSAFSFLLMGHSVYLHMTDQTVPGWATIISATSFMFGILFIMLGIIGEYIGRILLEVRNRPRFILHETIGMTSTPVSTE